MRLKKNKVIALRLDSGKLMDMSEIDNIPADAEIEGITPDSRSGLEIYRHSTSHIMAHAVKDLFPEAKMAIGPSIEEGFYYDFDVDRAFSPEDLERIEKKMSEIIAENRPFVRKTLSKNEAISFFEKVSEPYKIELISEIGDSEVTVYEEDNFTDLCRGPHLPSTGYVKVFKLLNVAGAYWRGDEKNKMLQRIYGTAFPTEKELKTYLNFLEEVKKRDHRRLGKDLDLFSVNEEVGGGLVLWHPRGALIRKVIEDYWRDEHQRNGYDFVYSPHVGRSVLWETSGHLSFYRENMYSSMDVEGQEYYVKPMNCPFHIMIYKNKLRSYRDLPLRFAELGTVYRFERSGVLHGLLRVRGFTQDDAHIFVAPEDMEAEVIRVLDFVVKMLRTFGFDEFKAYIATRPEKSVGDEVHWDRATQALKVAADKAGLGYEIDEGGGAFYGPKIDIKIKDALGRLWQCSTIQFDFNEPERFGMTFIGKDNQAHRPYMIHRALLGSIERFFGMLIEHYGGAFPLWLAPVQISILTISEKQTGFAENLLKYLKENAIRVEANFDNEKIGYKIRESTVSKIPFAVIIGDKEVESGKVTVRKRNGENLGPLTREELLSMLQGELKAKK
jgi:threonyl-tRNA synthetase